jgi:hypothetical protein
VGRNLFFWGTKRGDSMMRNGDKLEPMDIPYKPLKVPNPVYIDETDILTEN